MRGMSLYFKAKIPEETGIVMPEGKTEAERLVRLATLLIPRLERLTPDSSFAHQASGCRRSLLSISHRVAASPDIPEFREEELHALAYALEVAFDILVGAAHEAFLKKRTSR